MSHNKEIFEYDIYCLDREAYFIIPYEDLEKAKHIIEKAYFKWAENEAPEVHDECCEEYICNCLKDNNIDYEFIEDIDDYYYKTLNHYNLEAGINIENDFVLDHTKELMTCYANDMSIIDFDYWTRYQEVLNENISFNEYITIDTYYDESPMDIDKSDINTINDLKTYLKNYRENESINNKEKEIMDFLKEINQNFTIENNGKLILNENKKTGYEIHLGYNDITVSKVNVNFYSEEFNSYGYKLENSKRIEFSDHEIANKIYDNIKSSIKSKMNSFDKSSSIDDRLTKIASMKNNDVKTKDAKNKDLEI